MFRNHRPLLLPQPESPPAAEDHVHRLREMLRVMAPERGNAALGATIAARVRQVPEKHGAEPSNDANL
jgi:hypothetical protein